MIEEWREMWKCVTIENKLGLFVGARDDVANGTQSRRLDLDFAMRKEGHKFGDDTGINNHLDLVITAIGEIAQCPYGVHKDLERKRLKLKSKIKVKCPAQIFFHQTKIHSSVGAQIPNG